MSDPFIRTRMLIGDEPLSRLAAAKVAVFGVGGVGGFCVEALARAGIGTLHLYDDDTVSESNLNRQLAALHSTIGRPKGEVLKERVKDINPACRVEAIRMFYLPENADTVDFTQYDYVVDAIDTVAAKLELAVRCTALNIPIISAMGSGNKLDPTAFVVTDLSKTQGCPLARVMRKELRRRGIQHLKVVYSKEPAMTPIEDDDISCKYHCICPPGTQRKCTQRRSVPGSNAFVPSVAGLIIGGEVVKDLVGFVPMKG